MAPIQILSRQRGVKLCEVGTAQPVELRLMRLSAALAVGVLLPASACTNSDSQGAGQTDGEQTATADDDSTTSVRGTNSTGPDGADDDTAGTGSTTNEAPTTSGAAESSGSSGATTEDCADERVSDALCGPALNPCSITVDELVDEAPPMLYAPTITIDGACEPQVHYTTMGGDGDVQGYLARRAPDETWDSEPTPFSVGLQLEYDADSGQTLALGGAENPGLWTWDGRWIQPAAVAPEQGLLWRATAAGGHGQMYLATRDSSSGEPLLQLHTWDPSAPSAFTTTVIHQGDSGSGFGVGGGIAPSVAWWDGGGDGWQLTLSAGVAPTEVIDSVDLTTSAYAGSQVAVARGGAHVLYTTNLVTAQQGQQSQIRYARREESGDWNVSTVIADDPAGVVCSNQTPGFSGDTCDYDYTQVRVLDIVASDGGDVRLLFAEDHFIGQSVAGDHCPGPAAFPVPLNYWWCPQGSVTSRLFVGWPDDAGGVAYQSVVEDRRIVALDVALDTQGGINIAAAVTQGDESLGSSLHYVRLRAGEACCSVATTRP